MVLLYHLLVSLSRGFLERLDFFYSLLLRTVPCLIAPIQAFYQRKWQLATHPLGSNSSLPLLTFLLYHLLVSLSSLFLFFFEVFSAWVFCFPLSVLLLYHLSVCLSSIFFNFLKNFLAVATEHFPYLVSTLYHCLLSMSILFREKIFIIKIRKFCLTKCWLVWYNKIRASKNRWRAAKHEHKKPRASALGHFFV